jgi:heat shock protein beta
MDMIVNSLYSNRDVFLRELISNASDALDKIRFLGLSDAGALSAGSDLEIRVRADADSKTIVIEDTGVGMTRDDILSSLGTIARSGTAKFAEAIKEGKNDANLIGQFGVGFYSSFLVADRVVVQSRNHADDKQWRWEATAGSHEFKIREDTDAERLPRGTRVTLHLKEDAAEYADDKKLGALIKQYSEFIAFPIKLWAKRTESEQVEDADATEKARQKAKEEAKEGEEPAAVDAVMKTEQKEVQDWAVQNDNKPLWTRSPREVKKGEYDEFFKLTFKEFLEPLATAHFNVEGTIEFRALMFVPGMAPFEQQDWMAKSRSIRLYVKRVFISDEFDEALMPRYLNFIKGIVDSSDLPLNVSREILQESRVVRVIRKQLVKRSLDMLKEIAGRPTDDKGKSDYDTFYEAFGRNLKMGVVEDQANRDALAPLLRFSSSKSGDDTTSLADYVSRMKEGQAGIYYICTDSKRQAEAAPFTEQLVRKGYEVLYLTEAIDEVVFTNLATYDGKQLMDVSREGLEMDEEEGSKAEAAEKELKPLMDFIKSTLGERVERVEVSRRLSDSPVALVTSKFGWTANMERIMKSQTMADSRAMEYMKGRRIMELNPESPVIAKLKEQFEADPVGGAAKAIAELLYETALVTSGFDVESPKDFASRIYSLIAGGAGGGSSSSSGSDSGSAPANGKAAASGGADSSAPKREEVTPEVMAEGDGSDPWRS